MLVLQYASLQGILFKDAFENVHLEQLTSWTLTCMPILDYSIWPAARVSTANTNPASVGRPGKTPACLNRTAAAAAYQSLLRTRSASGRQILSVSMTTL